MKVAVLFFGSLREAAGAGRLDVELGAGAGLDALLDALGRLLTPAAVAALQAENVRVAVDQALVTPPVVLQPGCEVAFLPPVTGG